jgi:hypothetical protein
LSFRFRQVNGWHKTEKRETYDRESLFEYIDGAAELYLSYDFQELIVNYLVKADEAGITVELYRMGSSKDAFGIFSHDQEGGDIGIGQGSEYGSGWLRFWKGAFFVSVFSDMESEEVKAAILNIGRSIATMIRVPGKKPEILSYVPKDHLKHVRYFHTYEILNRHYFIANQNILRLNEHTDALLVQYEASKGKMSTGPKETFLLLIQYPDVVQAKIASKAFLDAYMPEAGQTGVLKAENGLWTALRLHGNFVVVVFDAQTQVFAEKLITNVRNRLGVREEI